MKRSQMLEELEIRIALCMNLHKTPKEVAEYALTTAEGYGMIPPEIHGTYDNVPTVTPTGNLDYSYLRAWEAE